MGRFFFFLLIALMIITTPLFAAEIAAAKSSGVKTLKADYRELFETIPINSNMAIQDFLNGFATYEETEKRLEVIRNTILYRSCKFKDNE